jgi:hypothetical protein
MPDFDNDQLRPEELYGGFDITDDETFTVSSATPESSAFVQTEPLQPLYATSAVDETLQSELSSTAASVLSSEALHGAPPAELAIEHPAEASVESPVEEFAPRTDYTSTHASAHTSAHISAHTSPDSPADEPAPSVQPVSEPLRFGFDEPQFSNQRIPPLPKKSALSRNGIALALTGGLSLLTAAIAWYMLTMQTQGIQAFFSRLMGRQQTSTQSIFEHNEQGTAPVEPVGIADSLAASGSASESLGTLGTQAPTQTSVASDLERIDSLNAVLMSKMEASTAGKQSESTVSTVQQQQAYLSSPSSSPLGAPSNAPSNTPSNHRDNFGVKSDAPPLNLQGQLSSTLQSTPQSSLQREQQLAQAQRRERQGAQQRSKAVLGARGRFAVQVYSTTSPFEAERVRRRLQLRRLPQTKVVPADLGDRFVYRVRFGSYATQREAQRAALLSGLSETLVVQTR